MKLKDYRADYYLYSSKTGDAVRQLAFAGIALIWVFKPAAQTIDGVPAMLLWPAVLFVAALAFDLLQGAYGTLTWGIFCRLSEGRGVQDEDTLDAPMYLNWITIFLFWAKVVVLLCAYGITLLYIHSLIRLP